MLTVFLQNGLLLHTDRVKQCSANVMFMSNRKKLTATSGGLRMVGIHQ